MVNMTIAIAPQLHKAMRKHPEVKWSEIARSALARKVALIESENDPIRKYMHKRIIEDGDEPEKLFNLKTR